MTAMSFLDRVGLADVPRVADATYSGEQKQTQDEFGFNSPAMVARKR